MAADGAGRGAGRIEQDCVEGRGVEVQRVGDDDLRMEFQPLEVRREHFQALGRAVDRCDACFGRRGIHRLAARRGAEIGDAHSGAGVEKPRRQGCGGVLHPPLAFRVAVEIDDGLVRIETHRAGRQNEPAEPLGPAGRVALDADVERRLGPMGGGDGPRAVASP